MGFVEGEKMTVKELQIRYIEGMHAVQTGVAYFMEKDPKETTPKHLRTGVNGALIQNSALAGLLMEKGVITEWEYWKAVVDMVEDEIKNYEEKLSELYGTKIKLH